MTRNPEEKMTHTPETYLSIATGDNPDLSNTEPSAAYIDGFMTAMAFIGKTDHPIFSARKQSRRADILKEAIASLPMFIHIKYCNYFFSSYSPTSDIRDDSILLKAFIDGYRTAFHYTQTYSLALFTENVSGATVKAIEAELYGGEKRQTDPAPPK